MDAGVVNPGRLPRRRPGNTGGPRSGLHSGPPRYLDSISGLREKDRFVFLNFSRASPSTEELTSSIAGKELIRFFLPSKTTFSAFESTLKRLTKDAEGEIVPRRIVEERGRIGTFFSGLQRIMYSFGTNMQERVTDPAMMNTKHKMVVL